MENIHVIFKDLQLNGPYAEGKTAADLIDTEELKHVICDLIDSAARHHIPLGNFTIASTVTMGKVSMITLTAKGEKLCEQHGM